MTSGRRKKTPPATHASDRTAGSDAAKGYEPSDVPVRGVVYALLGLFAGVGISAAMVAGLLALLAEMHETPRVSNLEAEEIEPPAPRLEISPADDRRSLEAAARQLLQGYAWTDRRRGRARIPIEEAMERLADHGWPDPPRRAAAAADAERKETTRP